MTSLTSFEQSLQIRLMALRETLRRSNRAEAEIAEIDAALQRLSEGTFGRCQRCGRALGSQRLLAEPTARFCEEGSPCR